MNLQQSRDMHSGASPPIGNVGSIHVQFGSGQRGGTIPQPHGNDDGDIGVPVGIDGIGLGYSFPSLQHQLRQVSVGAAA